MSRRVAAQRSAVGRDEGQALVEFALVLPLLLLLIFGMIQFGLVLNARQTVASAAQAAAATYAQTLQQARAGAEAVRMAGPLRPPLAAGDVRYALHDVPTGGTGQAANATSSADVPISADGIGQPGQFVVATVSYRYPSPVRATIAGFRFPDSFTITAEGVARIEKQGTATGGGGSSTSSPAQSRRCYDAFFEFTGGGKPPPEVVAGYSIAGQPRPGQVDTLTYDTEPRVRYVTPIAWFPSGSRRAYSTPLGDGVIVIDRADYQLYRPVANGVGAGRAPGPWSVLLYVGFSDDPSFCVPGGS